MEVKVIKKIFKKNGLMFLKFERKILFYIYTNVAHILKNKQGKIAQMLLCWKISDHYISIKVFISLFLWQFILIEGKFANTLLNKSHIDTRKVNRKDFVLPFDSVKNNFKLSQKKF